MIMLICISFTLKVNLGHLDLLQSSGEYHCAVFLTGLGNNITYYSGCKLLVHKKCSGLHLLTPNLVIGVQGAGELPILLMAEGAK